MQKLTREKMITAILATGSSDEEFLFNDLKGMDLLMDAVHKEVPKMKTEELKSLYEKAKVSEFFKED